MKAQATAGLNAIEVSVDVDLKQGRGMVGRAARRTWLHAAKTLLAEIKLINENVNHANRIVFVHILIQPLREQSTLVTVLAFDKARHRIPPPPTSQENHTMQGVFTQPGSKADIRERDTDVRFTTESGHSPRWLGCPLSAKSGHYGADRELLEAVTIILELVEY